MTTPTVNVTMTVCDQTGANVPGATVVAQLTGLDVYNAQYVFPNPQTFTADSVGHVTMPLFPNALGLRNTNYHITATHPTTGKMLVNVAVYVPNAGCDVTALVGNNPPSNPYPLPSVQPYSINLTALASQISAPNTLIYFTGAGQMSVTPLSAFGRSIISAADQSVLNLSSVLTGPITANSSGVTSVAAQTGTGSVFVMNNAPTLIAPALGTPASGVLTNCTGTAAALTAGNATLAATVTTNANLTGDVTSVGNATTLASATVTGKLLTGYVSGAGVVAATDSILAAIQKLNGNTVNLTTTVGTKAASGANTDITSLASPALASATATTQPASDNSTKVATTAQVQAAIVAAATPGVPSGTIIDYAGASTPTGYLPCDGSAVSRSTYAALFTAIATIWGAGDGSTTFNVPSLNGRATIADGTESRTETVAAGAVTTATDIWTVASNTAKWITGMKVRVSTTGGLPAPLVAATDYYIIRASAATIQFATTLANAQNGVVIDITTQGTGNHTATYQSTARTQGEIGGEETHTMSATELLSHTHTATSDNGSTGVSAVGVGVASSYNLQPLVSNTGGNAAMNNMQPYAVVKKFIKT